MARITGVGGIFFKCKDPGALSNWYRDVLEIPVEKWGGAMFQPAPDGPPMLVWMPFAADSTYFAPSDAPYMVNFAVDDLDGVVAKLRGKGVEITGPDSNPNGRFAWLVDPAGTKLELWEPKK
jgi:predicted enzyme related to lactoylglutathione lyase